MKCDRIVDMEETKKRICILARDSVRGAAEKFIQSEQEFFQAEVFLIGAKKQAENSHPFKYRYISQYRELLAELLQFDICIYYQVSEWAVNAIYTSTVPAIEFVGRLNATETDKTVPAKIVATEQKILDELDQKIEIHAEAVLVSGEYEGENQHAQDLAKVVEGILTMDLSRRPMQAAVLRRRITKLEAKQAELTEKVGAKRYQMIDRVVDSVYRSPVGKALLKFRHRDEKKAEQKPIKLAKIARKNVDVGRVDIVNHNFYDWNGETVFKGGAERYVYDLAVLLKKMGYRPRIVQGANHDFEKTYRGIKVVGVGGVKSGDYRSLSEAFNVVCIDAEFVIASPNELMCEMTSVPCIGINHGINFDSVWNNESALPLNEYEMQMDSMRNASGCVSVDTNFINWMRTREYELAEKMTYIPNYFDKKVFKRQPKKKGEKLTFVYPRRIYDARGYDITLEAFKKVLAKYPNVELRMAGTVHNDEVRDNLEAMMKKFPKQVVHEEYAMEEAYKAYEGADVVLVPTKYSEGTSLSCIEAQAQGIPVIVTTVGGLPNLVIDGYNGIMIAPTADDLARAVVKLIEKPSLRKKMGERCYEVAQEAFEKKQWNERWKKVIEKMSAETTARKEKK